MAAKSMAWVIISLCMLGGGVAAQTTESSSPNTIRAEKGTSTTYNYFSKEVDSPMWTKDIISADGENFTRLNDRLKVFASKQAVATERVVVSNLYKVAQSYQEGFDNGLENLTEATNGIPTAGLTIGLMMPLVPSATRTAIEGYIVSNSYDEVNNTDIYLIHFTQSLKTQPNIVFPYVMDGGLTTNNVTGSFRDKRYPGTNWTNIYHHADGTIEYDNCHLCFVQRPAQLKYSTIWTQPHLKWGSAIQGIDYGNIVHLAYGENLFNGILRDFSENKYLTVKDGAIMGEGVNGYEEGPLPIITSVNITNSENAGFVSPGAIITIQGANLGSATIELWSKENSTVALFGDYEEIKMKNIFSTENNVSFPIEGKWEAFPNAIIRIVVVTPYGAAYHDVEARFTKGE